MNRFLQILSVLLLILLLPGMLHGGDGPNLLTNGDFAQGFTDWLPFQATEPGAGSASLDQLVFGSASPGVKITYRGGQNWGMVHKPIPVEAGDNLSYRLKIKVQGTPRVEMKVDMLDAQGGLFIPDYLKVPVRSAGGWQIVNADLTVPPGAAYLQPSLSGYGKAEIWVDDFVISLKP